MQYKMQGARASYQWDHTLTRPIRVWKYKVALGNLSKYRERRTKLAENKLDEIARC